MAAPFPFEACWDGDAPSLFDLVTSVAGELAVPDDTIWIWYSDEEDRRIGRPDGPIDPDIAGFGILLPCNAEIYFDDRDDSWIFFEHIGPDVETEPTEAEQAETLDRIEALAVALIGEAKALMVWSGAFQSDYIGEVMEAFTNAMDDREPTAPLPLSALATGRAADLLAWNSDLEADVDKTGRIENVCIRRL